MATTFISPSSYKGNNMSSILVSTEVEWKICMTYSQIKEFNATSLKVYKQFWYIYKVPDTKLGTKASTDETSMFTPFQETTLR